MDADVTEWLVSHNLHITKLMDRKPYGLSNAHVKAGAEAIYDELGVSYNKRSDSYIIKDNYSVLKIAPMIWEKARIVKHDDFVEDEKILKHSKEIIRELKKDNYRLRVFAYASFFAVFGLLAFIFNKEIFLK